MGKKEKPSIKRRAFEACSNNIVIKCSLGSGIHYDQSRKHTVVRGESADAVVFFGG